MVHYFPRKDFNGAQEEALHDALPICFTNWSFASGEVVSTGFMCKKGWVGRGYFDIEGVLKF